LVYKFKFLFFPLYKLSNIVKSKRVYGTDRSEECRIINEYVLGQDESHNCCDHPDIFCEKKKKKKKKKNRIVSM